MSDSAFQKIKRGLEEAEAYMKGDREGHKVNVFADTATLAPKESELRGSWIVTAAAHGVMEDPTCQRIRALVANTLQLVAISSDGWRKLFRDPVDQRYWELSYPQSEMHGGGPPMLRVVPNPDLW